MVEYHEFQNYGDFEKVKTNESAPIYLNLYDNQDDMILSVCGVFPVKTTMANVL